MQCISIMRLLGAIHRLIRACRRDERTLRFESEHVKNGARRRMLSELAAERGDFARALEGLDGSSDGAHAGGSPFAAMGRAARTIRSELGVRTDGDAIAHCRAALRRTAGLYERVTSLPGLDGRILPLLDEQHARMVDEHRQLAYAQFS